VAFFYGKPASRIGVGFEIGANNERVYADALLWGMISERTGWFLNGGPVLGYGAVDGAGGRVGVSGWAAPLVLPLILGVNVIAVPSAPLLFLGTFSIKVGGGF
jgi:hypothetical protein